MKIDELKVKDVSKETLVAYLTQSGYKVEKPGPELLCGYTREQWQFIIDNHILCGFSNSSVAHAQKRAENVEALRPLNIISGNGRFEFINIDGSRVGSYPFCAPTTAPMTWRPWFGGKCPVPPGREVIVKLRDGKFNHTGGHSCSWDHQGGNWDIIMFMELK